MGGVEGRVGAEEGGVEGGAEEVGAGKVDAEEFDAGASGSQCNLDQCLRLLMQPEGLEEDGWRCPDCRKEVASSSHMSLMQAPPLLCVTLKRFRYVNMYYSRKIEKLVDFPVEGLDLKKYLAPGSDAGEVIYDLYGVVNHSGSQDYGHYTSCGRLMNQDNSTDIGWRKFNDEKVTAASEQDLVSSSAYVLFYRRRDFRFSLPVPSSFLQTPENSKNKAEQPIFRITGKEKYD